MRVKIMFHHCTVTFVKKICVKIALRVICRMKQCNTILYCLNVENYLRSILCVKTWRQTTWMLLWALWHFSLLSMCFTNRSLRAQTYFTSKVFRILLTTGYSRIWTNNLSSIIIRKLNVIFLWRKLIVSQNWKPLSTDREMNSIDK